LLKALILANNLSYWQFMINDKPNWVHIYAAMINWSSSTADFSSLVYNEIKKKKKQNIVGDLDHCWDCGGCLSWRLIGSSYWYCMKDLVLHIPYACHQWPNIQILNYYLLTLTIILQLYRKKLSFVRRDYKIKLLQMSWYLMENVKIFN
jgi:hypothetical protein